MKHYITSLTVCKGVKQIFIFLNLKRRAREGKTDFFVLTGEKELTSLEKDGKMMTSCKIASLMLFSQLCIRQGVFYDR